MKYSLEEQETFIRFDPITKEWTYETSYTPHIAHMLKLLKEEPDSLTNVETDINDDGSVSFVSAKASNNNKFPMPSNKFNKNMLPKRKRELTDEQREKLMLQLEKGRKTQGH